MHTVCHIQYINTRNANSGASAVCVDSQMSCRSISSDSYRMPCILRRNQEKLLI